MPEINIFSDLLANQSIGLHKNWLLLWLPTRLTSKQPLALFEIYVMI